MAKVPPFPYTTEEIREALQTIRHPMRVAVDRAKNPFNIGAIIRTAHSFMAKEILLIGDERWYERAAMGMQKFENVIELPSSNALIDYARENDAPLVVFEKDTSNVGLWSATLPDNAILVFGNEDDGCAPEIMEAASMIVGIPMFGINHSYPISIAAGIGMAEWSRQYYARQAAG